MCKGKGIYLSRGNEKIDRALIFNLPAIKTCPGATELCKKICYAYDSEVLYKHVAPQSRARNLAFAKDPSFRELMSAKLSRARLPRMRLHESGDFFNQKYLDAWTEIIGRDSKRTFWVYTKSWNLDFTEALKLKNLYLRYSVDATTKKYPAQDIPHAAVSASRDDFFVCPSTKVVGHSIRCMKDCSFCAECREPLTFRPHGHKSRLVGETELQQRLELEVASK